MKTIGKLSLLSLLATTCLFPPIASIAEPAAATAVQKDSAAASSNTDAATPAKKPDANSGVSLGNYLAGRFAASQGDTKNGTQYLRDSLKRDPNNLDVQKGLYRLLVVSGNIEEAIPLAQKLQGVKVVEEGSELSPEMLLAISAAKDKKYDDAEKYLAAIPKVGFNTLVVPQMRAWVSLAQGKVKTPLDIKSVATEGHVILPQVFLNAAFINDIAGFDKEAQKQYDSAVKDARIEPFRAVEALANFYGRKGMQDKREQLVNDYIADHGDSYLADELLVASPNAAPAPLVSDPQQGLAETFYDIATIFHGVRTPTDEIATLHLALYLRPDFPAAQFLLASAYELAQDFPAAAATYKTIDKQSPYFMRGRIRSVYDDVQSGKKDSALNELDAISRDNPQSIDALLAKGDILRAENKYKDAIEAYDAASARVPVSKKRHWIIYFSRGACYQLLGDWKKSEADMKKALALSPNEPEALNYLGYSWLTMRQNIPEAKKMVQEAYDARPEDANIIDSMGYSLYVTGDFAGAEEYFDQALERTPNDPTVNDHLGDTYWQLGRKTEARYQWERSLANKPDTDTEKGLHKKLKDGLEMIHPAPSSASAGDKKSPKAPAPVEE